MSSRAPWLHGRYPASSLLRAPPPPSRRQPISRGMPVIRPTLLRRFLGGTRTASPVAQRILVTVLPLPPRRSESTCRSGFVDPCCLKLKQRKLGLRSHLCRGHLWVHLRCGPVTRSPSRRWLCQSASDHLVSLLSATQATGLLTLALAGLAPAGCASLLLDALRSQCSSDPESLSFLQGELPRDRPLRADELPRVTRLPVIGRSGGESALVKKPLHEGTPPPPRHSDSTLPASECLGVDAQVLRELAD